MGWTWKDRSLLISLYPSLADSPVLLNSWPGFRDTVATMRASGELAATAASSAGIEKEGKGKENEK